MLLLETDSIAVASLIVAIIGVLVAVPAGIAAVRALKYAKEAPTAKDLERVEGETRRTAQHLEGVKEELASVKQHSANTSQHLEEMKSNVARIDKLQHKQQDKAELQQRANLVHIRASGNHTGNVPFKLELTFQDHSLDVIRVELLNEHDSPFGTFHCSETRNPGYAYVEIPMNKMVDWFGGGTPVELYHRRRLILKVWIQMEGVEVHRDMSVIVTDTMSPFPPNIRGFMLEGSV